MDVRPSARWTGSPGASAAAEASRIAAGSPFGGSAWSKSTASTVTPNSDTSAYSVRTDGCSLPVSICEIVLGESSSLRASSRRPRPRLRRIARSRGPSTDDSFRTCDIEESPRPGA